MMLRIARVKERTAFIVHPDMQGVTVEHCEVAVPHEYIVKVHGLVEARAEVKTVAVRIS